MNRNSDKHKRIKILSFEHTGGIVSAQTLAVLSPRELVIGPAEHWLALIEEVERKYREHNT